MIGPAARNSLSAVARGVNAVAARPLLALFIPTALICLTCALYFDQPVAEFYRNDAHPAVYPAFKYISKLGDATGYILIAALVVMVARFSTYFDNAARWHGRLSRMADAALFVVLSMAISGAIIHLLKLVVGRLRPKVLFESGVYDFSPFAFDLSMNSFPSGHTQAVWSLAVAMILVYRRYDVVYIAIAAAVGFSRIATYDHFISDVIFSVYIGIVTPILIKERFFDPRDIPVAVSFADAKLDDSAGARPETRGPDESVAEENQDDEAKVVPYASDRRGVPGS